MRRAALGAALAAVLLVGTACVMAQEPVKAPGYNCPKACAKAPNCHCASHDIPGGLAPADTPQFVVLTNDDAITVTTAPVIVGITSKHYNPQGCEVPATWFVSMNYTDYHLVQEVYHKNHEIASHTLHHVADPDLFQIVGMKLWLNQTAHVPLEKIRGFRAPFLIHSPEQRQILQQNGFLYDSSIPEPFPTATSPTENDRLWPYTMDYGLPQRCDLGTGPCSVNETHKGLWELPMWDVQDANGVVLTNMDPQGDIYEAYKREFDRSYGGNRSPVGVYIHAAWLMDAARNEQMNQFIQYALSHENVWFATISEVIDWMKNPVSATKYRQQRQAQGCDPPTDMWFPSGEYCEAVRCVNGNFSDLACACECIAEFNPIQPGWCADPQTGACTVAKVYDTANKTFGCPGASVREPPKPADVAPQQDPATANCGHALQDFVGLGLSGTQDNSALYSQALRAVDGLCDTCAEARDPSGNYFSLVLPERGSVTSVQLTVGEAVEGAFLFVGDESSNNGLDNPVCAMNLDLPPMTAVTVNCTGEGSYVTLATPKDLVICDMFVTAYPTAPLPSPPAQPTPSPSPAAATTGAEASGDLVSQLLTGGGSEGSFATTSDEEAGSGSGSGGGGPDYTRVGVDGVNPGQGPTKEELEQQLLDTAQGELAVINAAIKEANKKAAKGDRRLL